MSNFKEIFKSSVLEFKESLLGALFLIGVIVLPLFIAVTPVFVGIYFNLPFILHLPLSLSGMLLLHFIFKSVRK